MIVDFIEELIHNLTKERPVITDCESTGKYKKIPEIRIYNDSKRCYERISYESSKKTVHNKKAFAELITEELARRANETGAFATVQLNSEGGKFIPDENTGEYIEYYERALSQQWKLIKNGINKHYDHKNFLLFLQALKPSIDNFQEVFRSFAHLRMIGGTTLSSNPIFTEGANTSGYKCTYKLATGEDGEETFPSSFRVTVPFAKADDLTYDIDIDLLFYKDSDDEIMIEVFCPEYEHVEEQAIIEEADYIKKQLEDYEDLLILSDF